MDFFKDPEFFDFRASLDAEMKRLQGNGIGSKKKQAEVLTEEKENTLWEMGLLGDASSQSLLDSTMASILLCVVVRNIVSCRGIHPKFELVERPGERAY